MLRGEKLPTLSSISRAGSDANTKPFRSWALPSFPDVFAVQRGRGIFGKTLNMLFYALCSYKVSCLGILVWGIFWLWKAYGML